MLKATLLEESIVDEPTEDEVILYAESLGIDVDKERDLLYIAKEGISAHLPSGWQVLKDENNQIFYYDRESGISLWEHPLDRHFRDCVIQARQKKQNTIDAASITSEKSPGKKSVKTDCVVPGSALHLQSKLRTDKQASEKFATTTLSNFQEVKSNVNVPKVLTESHRSDNRPSTAEFRYDECRPVVTTKNGELHSVDDPTEYHDFKLSKSNTHEKSFKLFIDNQDRLQHSSRTNHLSSEGFKYWSEMYKENLRRADENLTVLQSKVRESLLSSNKNNTLDVHSNNENATPNSLTKCNPRITKQSHANCLSRCFSSSDLLNIVDSNQTHFKGTELLSSPGKMVDDSLSDNILCPEVGVSPTVVIQAVSVDRKDSKNDVLADFNSKSPMPQNNANSSYQFTPGSRTNLTEQETGVEGKSTNENHSNQNNVKSKPNRSMINLSECISHLVEERSRIENKLFRLKLLYKTYKRRLDNLDASLSALHEQTNVEQSGSNVLSVPKICKQCCNSENLEEKINQPMFTSSTNEKDPPTTIPQNSIVATCVSNINETVCNKLHSRLSYHRHPDVFYAQRSVSVPRSPISCSYSRNSNNSHTPSVHHLHDNSVSVSHDLAVSLASIDVQLHHVLKQLDSHTDESLQSHVDHCMQNQRPVSVVSDAEQQHHHCTDDEATNVLHIQRCLENVNLSNEPLPGSSGCCTSSNLTYSPSCSCCKTSCQSHRTMDLFMHSPINCSPNPHLDLTPSRRNSILPGRTRENISYSNATLKAFYITSQGQASIQLTLKLIAHYSMNIESKLQIHFAPNLNKDEKSFNNYQLYWHSLKETEFTVFIYNLTHTLQYQTQSTSICLDNLTQGTKYKFCIVETIYTCKSSSWNCILKTIPIIKQSSISLSTNTMSIHYQLTMHNLQIQNIGSNWLQLSWLPISQTINWQINEIPYAYIIIAIGKYQTIHCSDRIYSIHAPWASNIQSSIMSYIQQTYHNIILKCTLDTIYKEINLYGYIWPEWNTFREQENIIDEWNSINEFLIELNQLIPLQQYNISIKPLFHTYHGIMQSITTELLNPSMDCNLTLEETNQGESIISWSLPLTIKRNLLDIKNALYILHISHIGRPEKNVEKTCFIDSCQMKNLSEIVNNFLPQLDDEPQRLNCNTIKLPIHSKQTKFTLNCQLSPCKLYEISIELLHENYFIKEFQSPKSPSNVYAKSLAQNVIQFQIDQPKPSTFHQCTTTGYIVSISDYNNKQQEYLGSISSKKNFTVIMINDLQSNMNHRFQGYNFMNNLFRYQFFLQNPFPTANQIIVRIQSMPVGDRNWIEVNIPLVDSNCYLDCIWPNQSPYYRFTHQLNNYYLGQYSSYIISQSFKNNLQIVQCPLTRQINNNQTRNCYINPSIQLTEYAYCKDENSSIQTCFIPTCDVTASIPCITLARSINVNSSTIQIEWLETQSLQQSNQFNFDDDLMRTNSYLFILYQLNESNKIKDRQCAQYTFVVISKDTQENWKNYFHDLVIQSLIHSCLGQTKHLFTNVKQSNVITFEKLLPSTLYEVNIIPFNKYGQPGASWSHEVLTTIALPCKPESIEIYRIESHALSIKWYLSRNIYCGYPSRIHIYYKHIINSNQPMKEEEEEEEERQQQQWYNIDSEYTMEHIRLSSLRPCQTYCVKMKFINSAGSGSLSKMICNRTKRAAFTNIPTITSELIEINKSTDKHHQSYSSSLMLRLRIHLNYTNYCPVLYEFLSNIYNDDVQNAVITVSPSPEVILRKNIQRGILYQLRGRVRSDESIHSPMTINDEMDVFKFSQWSPITLLYVNMSNFQFINFTVNVQRPIEITQSLTNKPYYYQCYLNVNHYIRPILRNHQYKNINDIHQPYLNNSLLNKYSYCIQLNWNISGKLNGLLGLAIQFFIPFKQNSLEQYQWINETLKNNINALYLNKLTTIDTLNNELQQCVQFIWLPCSGCFHNYSLHNVHPRVIEKLRKLIDICKFNQQSYQTVTRIYHRNNQLSNINDLQIELNALQLNEFNQIMLNQSIYQFNYYVINPTFIIFSQLSQSPMIVKRGYRSIHQNTSSISSTKLIDTQHNGYVIVYSVTADDVIYAIKHQWRLNDDLSTSNMSGSMLIVSIICCLILIFLLIFIIFIIVFNRHRLIQTKFTGLHTIEYCEGDEEIGYELREEYKSPVIPLKIPRQPDSINIHDFIKWSEKNINSLQEEFKSLNIHSYRQEQAKHLTCTIGQRPENRLRNKYRNLLPFDQNYVQLLNSLVLPESEQFVSFDQSKENGDAVRNVTSYSESTNENENTINMPLALPDIGSEQWIPSNYMNASWIPSQIPGVSCAVVRSGQLPHKYIAAQAPVDHTRSLFWQMIWDHHVQLIVTLTKPIENGKEKCSVYWPTNDSIKIELEKYCETSTKRRVIHFGRFKIQLLCEVNYSAYVRRNLKVYDCKSVNNEQYRNITQLHMLKWPDFSTPSTEDFLCLLYAYWTERRLSLNDSPVLVHCSAGIGRTGTFICLDQLCQQVRYDLQPNLQIFLQKFNHKINEPIYVNLNKDNNNEVEDKNGINEVVEGEEEKEEGGAPPSLSTGINYKNDKENEQYEMDDLNIHEHLLNETFYEPVGNNKRTMKQFLFSRRNYKGKCINIFKSVLWLRSKRSHMVQTVDQYIFIYEFLASFIKQLKEEDRIYENI
ncbi:hypothetical protein MN116_008014 [Schistosoma mekongi]|uniref:protein-tyrosine-phosphatase n=1 Tax=Schistosoma mekongi TaxID=38744 RepID=A0AAE2D2L7_SCHME|nr:hypothetical protein MN116_008014 [Schistosoma mekongi]